ncbi:NAD(P)-binding protein [Aspergillus steynii IBT 23096]|uniref:NAD(P)-binding protein n=1 Tax=Aspergillus steynii IBT 23096 TaxID=1392250 RepID=A0A2I2FV32_9EURO|nr:NAD(P)-binding protein [Aspergillus steynii IBT 23096]PLB44500.1 NAD(P)-binding protein [Aspergillus steynii IBT 23096]
MDVQALYHMLRLEVLHPKLFTFARDGPLPLMWNNLTTRSKALQPSELDALTGRTALIAGATSGCGLQLAKILAAHCTRLIITARDPQRGQQAVEEIRNSLSSDTSIKSQIEVWPLEMASFQSVRDFTERVNLLPSLDIAVLNAGIWHLHFARSTDSFETHLQVNYLSSCGLSLSLLTALGRNRSPASPPGRLLNVTSEGHALEDIPAHKSANEVLESFNDPDKLTCYTRYRLSKLLSMIWTHELASSIDNVAHNVEIASFTPGASQTQICRDLGTGPIVRVAMGAFCQSAEEGSWGYVRALGAREFHGRYFFRETACQPTDCVTAEKYKAFREDLMRQTLAVLGKHIEVPADINDWLGDISK